MIWSPTSTRFSLWSPKADSVMVNIYDRGEGGQPVRVFTLKRDDSCGEGYWTACAEGNLLGMFYTYQVRIGGKWLAETPDPDVRAVGINGQRGAIINMADTDPEGWQDDRSPVFHDQKDAVIYEMHHRDFSIDKDSGITDKGKYLALTEHGTHNAEGFSTGIDHLRELGVTHVHLLPSFDFGSIDEKTGHAISGGGRSPSTYNWGYDPVNYNVPEGSYSTDAHNPIVRIREFKQMVMALHKAGIRVVMDVVYNHVFDHDRSSFHLTAPGEFFRYRRNGKPANGSGCGNETASDRECMRRFMVRSVTYWMKEYHIDGFRFDLMGIHDTETMNLIREAAQTIDPNVLLYGEGWAADTPAYPRNKLALKARTSRLGGIAAFCDEMRDALRGGWLNDEEGGFLIGNAGHEESIRFGLAGAVSHKGVDMQKVNYSKKPWAATPSQMISYVSCHDDLCIADRIRCTLKALYGRKQPSARAFRNECIRLQKLAYTAVLTSRGIPFIWCGDEIMRGRKGVRNCYSSPDSVNAIPWKLKTDNHEVFSYFSSLIQLRRQLRFQDKEVTFLPVKDSNLIATLYGNDIIVILNSNRKLVRIVLPHSPEGRKWKDILSSGAVSLSSTAVKVAPQTAVILQLQ